MRVSSRVVLIACSASAIGAPAAVACSPQDYMSPEEWQALSPEQRAENVAHTHEADAPAATAATPPPAAPADPPATRDAAPQVSQPTGDQNAGSPKVDAPPARGAAPVLPRLDAPSHRRPVAERPSSTGTPRAEKSPSRPTALTAAPQAARAAASARTTVVAVEQLTRMAAGSPAAERAAARRAERRASERAAERRARTEQRRDNAAPATDAHRDAQVSGRTPVRADEAPPTPSHSPDGVGRLTAWAALTLALAAFVARLMRRPRPEAPAETTTTQVTPPTSDAVAADPIEAELQAIIAAQTAPRARPSSAQEAGTGGDSSTATNSA